MSKNITKNRVCKVETYKQAKELIEKNKKIFFKYKKTYQMFNDFENCIINKKGVYYYENPFVSKKLNKLQAIQKILNKEVFLW